MPDPAVYRPVFSELAANAIVALPRRKARRALDLCQRLARNPILVADYVLRDADGHAIEHLLAEGFIVAYWIDHAVKTVLIVEIDAAD